MNAGDATTIRDRLDGLGIIALLPSELPRLFEVADALLASPIEAVEIIPNGPSMRETVAAFRQRGGSHLLVGAGRVESVAELDSAIDAGAQFASSAAEFRLPLLAHARRRDFLYIPTVHAPGQALIAARAGALWQRIRDDIDTEGLEGLMERTGDTVKYIINQVSVDYVDACFESHAALVCVNDIYVGPHQSMRDLIQRARDARRQYLDSVAGADTAGTESAKA